jgi:hypothetical protein
MDGSFFRYYTGHNGVYLQRPVRTIGSYIQKNSKMPCICRLRHCTQMSGGVMIRLFVRNDYKPATSMLLVRLN